MGNVNAMSSIDLSNRIKNYANKIDCTINVSESIERKSKDRNKKKVEILRLTLIKYEQINKEMDHEIELLTKIVNDIVHDFLCKNVDYESLIEKFKDKICNLRLKYHI